MRVLNNVQAIVAAGLLASTSFLMPTIASAQSSEQAGEETCWVIEVNCSKSTGICDITPPKQEPCPK